MAGRQATSVHARRFGAASRDGPSLPGRVAARLGAPLARAAGGATALLLAAGCPLSQDSARSLAFNNTSDPTNGGAAYVGSATCRACHPDVAARAGLHGHAHALSAVRGQPPQFPPAARRAGVPEPPPGRSWAELSYVIGGYEQGALFVDQDGFLLTTGVTGREAQWNLELPASGGQPGLVDYLPGQQTRLGLAFDCFRCHTTGAAAQDPQDPRSQDGRPGIGGTWAEAGVGCEACHGPGSNHVSDPRRGGIFVDATVQTCAGCHAAAGPDVIRARAGFVEMGQQYAELRASGGHARFACRFCHAAHDSAVYDRANGIRNECRACHPDQNLTRFHQGAVFVRGAWVEPLSCQSCHMPYATKSLSAVTAPQEPVATGGRIGDVRTHIFRIRPEVADFRAMFDADGARVLKDERGRAAVTVDFVCLRCHSGAGSAFAMPLAVAGVLAEGIHDR